MTLQLIKSQPQPGEHRCFVCQGWYEFNTMRLHTFKISRVRAYLCEDCKKSEMDYEEKINAST